MRRPDARSVKTYLAALQKYKGTPPLEIWRRFSLRTRVAAGILWRTGRPAPLDLLPETPAATRRPRPGDDQR